MKHIYKIMVILAAALAFAGCLQSVEDNTGFTPQTPSISFSEEVMEVENAGGEISLQLNSNLPWRVKTDATWLTISKENGLEGGTIIVTAAKNRLREIREGVVTAWVTEDYKAYITIRQAAASASESFTYYVKTDGNGTSDGLSWENATTLPTALELVGEGDKICLAAGTYTPVALISGGETEKERTFEIHSNFTIEGGYPADAATGAVADPANETILDGASVSAYHVVVISAPQSATGKVVLKNLTIQGGTGHTVTEEIRRQAGATLVDAAYGAGLYIGRANAEIINCKSTGNTGTHAAGCFIAPGAVVTFEGCSFIGNTVTANGGGVWNSGGNIVMNNCTIAQNTAAQQAAGFYSIDAGGTLSVSRIYNSSFYENDNTKSADKRSGGAAYIRAGSDAVFVNCSFSGNKSGWGAVVQGHGTSALPSNTVLINCTMTGNHANNGGGALFAYNVGAQITAYNCIISGNTTSGYAPETGTLDGVDASRVLVKNSILGSGLVDENGGNVGGWSFAPASMLGAFDYYAGALTKSFPLVVSADNPAVDQGMSNADLTSLAATFNPVVDAAKIVADQNGEARTKKSIGASAAK